MMIKTYKILMFFQISGIIKDNAWAAVSNPQSIVVENMKGVRKCSARLLA
jgi:hypothetical protein